MKRTGFFIVEDALPPKIVDDLNAVLDRLEAELRPQQDLSPHERLNIFDFIGKDDSFLELLDWYKTFPKVWGILGWHIQLYHSHLGITPPLPSEERSDEGRLGWHQDSGRLNMDLESNPASANLPQNRLLSNRHNGGGKWEFLCPTRQPFVRTS